MDNSVEASGPSTVVTMEAAQRTWTDPDGDTAFDLIGELNLRRQHVTATRPGGAYLRVRISDDLRRYLVDHNADDPGVDGRLRFNEISISDDGELRVSRRLADVRPKGSSSRVVGTKLSAE